MKLALRAILGLTTMLAAFQVAPPVVAEPAASVPAASPLALAASAPVPATSVAASALASAAALPMAAPGDAAQELDAWVTRLVAENAATRQAAIAAIDSATPALVPAVAKRLGDLKKSSNRDAMGRVLTRARKSGGGESDGPRSAEGRREREGRAGSLDWFERVMASATPADPDFRDLATILGLSRMLVHIGTLPAAREVIGIYAGFGDLLRIDVERQMKVLSEHAVAALIEVRRGEVKNLRPWAAKVLDVLGKTVPGEAVQTADNQILADVLRAYGSTKDTDAARVIVSFANSDRTQVREAAREAVTMLAENGLWQLRESYENLVGKKAPEDWGWEKLSGELFQAYDRARLSEVYDLMDEGLSAYKAHKVEAATSAFDRVLARVPLFLRRKEMVSAYLDLARSLSASDRPRAMSILRKVLLIDPGGPHAQEVEAELAYLSASDLAAHGVVDESGYRRAVSLDPNHAQARAALSRITTRSEEFSSATLRYGLAIGLGLFAIAISAWALLWRRTKTA